MIDLNGNWDYVIVGGGSAGCVVANELTRDSSLKVLLLEAGRDTPPGCEPSETLDPYYAPAMRPENFWPKLSVSWTEGRNATFYEQARILGGGSSVNSMVAVRATPDDFDDWTSLGIKGWKWGDVLPFYAEIETDTNFGATEGHGASGPISIRRHTVNQWPRFCAALSDAAKARELPFIEDMNMDFRDGVARVPINSTPERRVSSAAAFLDSTTRARPNLKIITNATVRRVEIEQCRAVAVDVEVAGSNLRVACQNVILSAGAIWSPTILQHSGIGDGDHLVSIGKTVAVHLPGVGRNLQEHPTASLAAFLKPDAAQNKSLRPHANMALRFNSHTPGSVSSDIYCAVIAKSSWHPLGRRIGNILLSLHRPFSRGDLRIPDATLGSLPTVNFRFFTDERDLQRIIAGLRFAFELLTTPDVRSCFFGKPFLASYSPFVQSLNRFSKWNAFRSFAALSLLDNLPLGRPTMIGRLLAGNVDANAVLEDDTAISEWLIENVTGFFHPVGTCAMGPSSSTAAVVNEFGRVHRVSGLHVIDASTMPQIIRANTNITTMAMALKMARELVGKR